MLYEKLKELSNTDFKRYCGVGRKTFDKMCEIVRRKSAAQRLVSGRPAKLVVEDQVLLSLEYLREYRTMFHIATSWGISESTVSRIVKRVEDILSRAREFRLPVKRRELLPPDVEVVVVDVVETAVERPKKNNVAIIRARKSGTP
jgi:hypothetical protein